DDFSGRRIGVGESGDVERDREAEQRHHHVSHHADCAHHGPPLVGTVPRVAGLICPSGKCVKSKGGCADAGPRNLTPAPPKPSPPGPPKPNPPAPFPRGEWGEDG